MPSLLQLLHENRLPEELNKNSKNSLLSGGDRFNHKNKEELIKSLELENQTNEGAATTDDYVYDVLFVSACKSSTTKKTTQNNSLFTAPLFDHDSLKDAYFYGKNFVKLSEKIQTPDKYADTKPKKVTIYCTAMPNTMLTAKMIHLGIEASKKWENANNTIKRIAYLTKPKPSESKINKKLKLKDYQYKIGVEKSNSYAIKLNEIFKGGYIDESFESNFIKRNMDPIYYEQFNGYKEFLKSFKNGNFLEKNHLNIIVIDSSLIQQLYELNISRFSPTLVLNFSEYYPQPTWNESSKNFNKLFSLYVKSAKGTRYGHRNSFAFDVQSSQLSFPRHTEEVQLNKLILDKSKIDYMKKFISGNHNYEKNIKSNKGSFSFIRHQVVIERTQDDNKKILGLLKKLLESFNNNDNNSLDNFKFEPLTSNNRMERNKELKEVITGTNIDQKNEYFRLIFLLIQELRGVYDINLRDYSIGDSAEKLTNLLKIREIFTKNTTEKIHKQIFEKLFDSLKNKTNVYKHLSNLVIQIYQPILNVSDLQINLKRLNKDHEMYDDIYFRYMNQVVNFFHKLKLLSILKFKLHDLFKDERPIGYIHFRLKLDNISPSKGMLNGPLNSFYKKKKALFTYLYKYFNSVIEICYSFDASNSSHSTLAHDNCYNISSEPITHYKALKKLRTYSDMDLKNLAKADEFIDKYSVFKIIEVFKKGKKLIFKLENSPLFIEYNENNVTPKFTNEEVLDKEKDGKNITKDLTIGNKATKFVEKFDSEHIVKGTLKHLKKVFSAKPSFGMTDYHICMNKLSPEDKIKLLFEIQKHDLDINKNILTIKNIDLISSMDIIKIIERYTNCIRSKDEINEAVRMNNQAKFINDDYDYYNEIEIKGPTENRTTGKSNTSQNSMRIKPSINITTQKGIQVDTLITGIKTWFENLKSKWLEKIKECIRRNNTRNTTEIFQIECEIDNLDLVESNNLISDVLLEKLFKPLHRVLIENQKNVIILLKKIFQYSELKKEIKDTNQFDIINFYNGIIMEFLENNQSIIKNRYKGDLDKIKEWVNKYCQKMKEKNLILINKIRNELGLESINITPAPSPTSTGESSRRIPPAPAPAPVSADSTTVSADLTTASGSSQSAAPAPAPAAEVAGQSAAPAPAAEPVADPAGASEPAEALNSTPAGESEQAEALEHAEHVAAQNTTPAGESEQGLKQKLEVAKAQLKEKCNNLDTNVLNGMIIQEISKKNNITDINIAQKAKIRLFPSSDTETKNLLTDYICLFRKIERAPAAALKAQSPPAGSAAPAGSADSTPHSRMLEGIKAIKARKAAALKKQTPAEPEAAPTPAAAPVSVAVAAAAAAAIKKTTPAEPEAASAPAEPEAAPTPAAAPVSVAVAAAAAAAIKKTTPAEPEAASAPAEPEAAPTPAAAPVSVAVAAAAAAAAIKKKNTSRTRSSISTSRTRSSSNKKKTPADPEAAPGNRKLSSQAALRAQKKPRSHPTRGRGRGRGRGR